MDRSSKYVENSFALLHIGGPVFILLVEPNLRCLNIQRVYWCMFPAVYPYNPIRRPYIYIHTTGFGPREKKKVAGEYHFLVYMQTAQICSNTHKARLRRSAPPWCCVFAACLSILHIHQEIVCTSHFLIFSRPGPGGGVYVYTISP